MTRWRRTGSCILRSQRNPSTSGVTGYLAAVFIEVLNTVGVKVALQAT